jgi:hypothetical protein
VNQRIDFLIIDYYQNNGNFAPDIEDASLQTINGFKFNSEDIRWPFYCGTKLVSTEKLFKIDVTSSQDGIFAVGTINNSDVFLINVEAEKIVFTKSLTKSINENDNCKVLQTEVSDNGTVHILRHYAGDKEFLVYENYDKAGNVAQMHIIEDMKGPAQMRINRTRVIIMGQNMEKTIHLI